MENNVTVEELYGEDRSMKFTTEIKNSMFKLCKWARIVALVGMVFILISSMSTLFMGSMMPQMPEEFQGGGFFNVIIFCLMAFAFYLMYLLYNFASKMMIALKSDDEDIALEAIESLRKHYTIYGIIILVYAGLFIVSFLFLALAGFSNL